jgi:hypothetical protein
VIDAAGDRFWWAEGGATSASGDARAQAASAWSYAVQWSGDGSGGDVTYSETGWSTEDAEDHYRLTGTWLTTRDEAGAVAHSAALSNHRWGSYANAGSVQWSWDGDGSGSGAGTSGGTSWNLSGSYDETVAARGFRFPSWSGQEDWRPEIGIGDGFPGSSGTWSDPGEGDGGGEASGSDSGSGGDGGDPPQPPAAVPVPAFLRGGVVATIGVPNPQRAALDLADWVPWLYPQAGGEGEGSGSGSGSGGGEPGQGGQTSGGWWSQAWAWIGLRPVKQAAAEAVIAGAGQVADTLTELGVATRSPALAAWAGYNGGTLKSLAGFTAHVLIDPETTVEHAVDTFATYYVAGGGGLNGAVLGLDGVLGLQQLAEAAYGYDILDGHKLSNDEVFDRAVGGVGAGAGAFATIGGGIVAGAEALGYNGFRTAAGAAAAPSRPNPRPPSRCPRRTSYRRRRQKQLLRSVYAPTRLWATHGRLSFLVWNFQRPRHKSSPRLRSSRMGRQA